MRQQLDKGSSNQFASICYKYQKVIFEDMNYLLTFSANIGITWDLDTVFYN